MVERPDRERPRSRWAVYLNVVPEGSVSVLQPDAGSWKSSENTTTPGVGDGDAEAIAVLALGLGVEPLEPMSA